MWAAVLFPCVTPSSPSASASVSLRRISRNCVLFSSNNIPSNSKPPPRTTSAGPSDFPLASRIIVRNLSYTTTKTSIQKEFSNFGQVAEVKLAKDENGKKSKGYAFVQYTSQEDAMLALENMDHKMIDGRIVHVEIAKIANYALRQEYPRTSGPPKEQNA